MEKAYETYKDSGVEWIGEIPKSWDLVSLKYSDETIMGQSPDSNDYLLEDNGELPFLQGNAEFNELYPSPRLWCATANKKSIINDVLISVRAPIGALNISNQEYGIGRGLCAVRGINHSYKYLYYFLKIANEYLNVQGTGSTFKAISTSVLRELKIPNLSLKEQTKIVAYLDYHTQLIDTLISKKETLIQKLQEQRQAIINEAVTKGLNNKGALKDSGIEWLGEIPEHWTIAKFKYFAKIKNGKDQKSVLVDDGKYPILGTGGEFGRSSEFLYDKPSVLLGRKGTIDKPQFIEEPFWTVDTLFYTEIESDVVPKFLFYLSTLIPFSLLQESSAVPSMTQDKLHNVFLPKPSYEEQLEIVTFLENELDKLNILNQLNLKQIQKLKEYRQSLISEAVTGKIDVRDWQKPNS